MHGIVKHQVSHHKILSLLIVQHQKNMVYAKLNLSPLTIYIFFNTLTFVFVEINSSCGSHVPRSEFHLQGHHSPQEGGSIKIPHL